MQKNSLYAIIKSARLHHTINSGLNTKVNTISMSLLSSSEHIVTRHSPEGDYSFVHFAEGSPHLVDVSRRIHADCYSRLGFVKPESIVNGFFADGIDKARGMNVDFTVGFPKGSDPQDSSGKRGSYRSVSADSDNGLEALPSYLLCKDNITPAGHRLLERDVSKTKEIATLSGEDSASIYYMLREAIANGMPNQERWFFGIVSSTYDKLNSMFGPNAMKQIGSPTKIPDNRVGDHIRIIPAFVETKTFVDTVAKNFALAKDERSRRKIGGTLLFCVEGIDNSELSVRTNLTVSAIKLMQQGKGRQRNV